MFVTITFWWYWFFGCFNVVLVTMVVMTRQSSHFFTTEKIRRPFNMMELEFPASEESLIALLRGIDELPAAVAEKCKKALRGQLYVDFLFMPAAYGGIFLLCMKIASKMGHLGQDIFAILAWVQFIPLICDIAENIYLLNKIKDPRISSGSRFLWYQRMEIAKWGISLTGLLCSVFALAYYWIVGQYHLSSLRYVGFLLAEIVLLTFLLWKKK